MSEELEGLKEVARRLAGAGIPYMITGSTAANFYAVPRMTRDIDIVVELSERDIGKFILAFEKDHYLEPETVREAVKNKRMFNLIHDQYVIKVDFIVRKDTPYRRREFSRKKKNLGQRPEFEVGRPENLIFAKPGWAKRSHSQSQLKEVPNLILSGKRPDRT